MTEIISSNYNTFSKYMADVAVTMAFGVGYYLFKGLKNTNNNESKTIESKVDQTNFLPNKFQNLQTLEEFHLTITEDTEGIEDPFIILNRINSLGLIPTIDTYNALLLNCVENKNDYAVSLMKEEIMDYTGPIAPDAKTFNIFLLQLKNKFAEIYRLNEDGDHVKIYHEFDQELMNLVKEFEERTIYMDTESQNIILDALIDQDRLNEAWLQFSNMKVHFFPNLLTFKIILKAIKSSEEINEHWLNASIEVFDQAENGIELDNQFYLSLIEGCYLFKKFEKVLEIFQKLKEINQFVNEEVYTLVIKSYAKTECLEEIKNIYSELSDSNMLNARLYKLFISSFFKCRALTEARNVLEEVESKEVANIEIYVAFLNGLKLLKNYDMTLTVYETLKLTDFFNVNVLNAVLATMIECHKYSKMEEIYNECLGSNLHFDLNTYSILLKGYAKSNNITKAIEFYDYISSRKHNLDVNDFNVILDCLVRHNEEEKVLSIYNDLIENNISPNVMTFGILIKLYCNLENSEKAFEFFNQLINYQIQPSVIIYQMLIKLLIKTQNIDEAIALFNNMFISQVQPDSKIFELIIKACIEKERINEASQYVLFATNSNIKLENYVYVSFLESFNKTDSLKFFEKESLLHVLFKAIESSQISLDYQTVKKFKCFLHHYTSSNYYINENVNVSTTSTNNDSFYSKKSERRDNFYEEQSIYENPKIQTKKYKNVPSSAPSHQLPKKKNFHKRPQTVSFEGKSIYC